MIVTMAGLVLTAAFVACVTVVLMAMADIASDRPQGGRPAVVASYAGRPIPENFARPRRVQSRHATGRHRR